MQIIHMETISGMLLRGCITSEDRNADEASAVEADTSGAMSIGERDVR